MPRVFTWWTAPFRCFPNACATTSVRLRPNEEKLAYSVIFEMNNDADVLHAQVAKTVICSDRRFTYEEDQTIIERNGQASPR